MNGIAASYLACWNETDPAARRRLLGTNWSEGATYVDPMMDVVGLDELDAAIAGVQEQFPDFTFTPLGDVDGHHRQVRFRWGLGPRGADPVIEGFDVVVTGADGKITSVLGFLDKIPA